MVWYMSGLNRYDGYVPETFHHSIKVPPSFFDDHISKITGGPFKNTKKLIVN